MSRNGGFQIWVNGVPAAPADLQPLAFAGFAHFTAMQVREAKVKGLDLHLARLREASLELFGQAMPDEQVRQHLRTAIAQGSGEASLVATMFSKAGEFTRHGSPGDPLLLVQTSEPFNGPAGPLRLSLVRHQRWLSHLKLTGEAAKTHYLRQAVEQGFDDAAFHDESGRIGEATIWNLAFLDGDTVVWPQAYVLAGVTMQIVKRQLSAMAVPYKTRPIRFADLPNYDGAAVMNSWTAGVPVSTLGPALFPASQVLLAHLHNAYAAEPAMAP